MMLQQIYWGDGLPSFIRIAEFYKRYYKTHFGICCPDTLNVGLCERIQRLGKSTSFFSSPSISSCLVQCETGFNLFTELARGRPNAYYSLIDKSQEHSDNV